MPRVELKGRRVLVTGASRGIGAATAACMASRGARVILLARSERELAEQVARLQATGATAQAFAVDLSNPAEVGRVARTVLEDGGAPDVLVNNAGSGRYLYAEETSPEEAVALMTMPYFAAFWITHAFLPGMLARGSGHIVNITSPSARLPWPGATGHTAARWAMRGFSEALRADTYGTGVSVTTFIPGQTATPYFQHNLGSEERLPPIARWIRVLPAEEVGEGIVRAVEHRRAEVLMPTSLVLLDLLLRIAPRLVERLVWRKRVLP